MNMWSTLQAITYTREREQKGLVLDFSTMNMSWTPQATTYTKKTEQNELVLGFQHNECVTNTLNCVIWGYSTLCVCVCVSLCVCVYTNQYIFNATLPHQITWPMHIFSELTTSHQPHWVNLRVKNGRNLLHNTQWTMTVTSGWTSGWRMEGICFITPSEPWRLHQGEPQSEGWKELGS